MRAVFVNHAHPLKPHVSGMRVSSFANALARRGHQIVLLTSSLKDNGYAKQPQDLAAELAGHDWSTPYHLVCPPVRDVWLSALRNYHTPAMIRKSIVFYYYLNKSGVFHDWVKGAKPFQNELSEVFRPHVVWGTFGNTDTWVICREVARMSNAPFVIDIKDGWDNFIPYLFRGFLARKFYNAAALTVNSVFHACLSKKWFPQDPVVVYSGVPSFLLDQKGDNYAASSGFQITLVGSIYSRETLDSFIRGVRTWVEQLTPEEQAKAKFVYAGGEHIVVSESAKMLENICQVHIHSYLDLPLLFDLCQASTVNAYLWSPKTFHHKLVELLCCRRPIVVYPGEHHEAEELTDSVNGRLYRCTCENDLHKSFDDIRKTPLVSQNAQTGGCFQLFTWDHQCKILEQILLKAAELAPNN
jgi:hypothetical protein